MDLVYPKKPREVSYDELVEVLQHHFGGTHNKMVERAKFRELKRSGQESVNDFVVKLKNGARNCQFGDLLEENLLEQFRIGANSKPIRDRIALMPVDEQQKLRSVLDVATQVELDEKFEIVSTSNQVQQVRQHYKKNFRPSDREKPALDKKLHRDSVCYRCSRSGHIASSQQCPARSKTCNTCHKVGHYSKSKFCKGIHKPQRRRVDNVNDTDAASSNSDDEGLYTVNRISKHKMPRCEVLIKGETIPFIIDTGACDNIIDTNAYNKIKHKVKLTQADKELFAFGNNSKLDFLGKFDASIVHAKSDVMTTIFVFNGQAIMLDEL